MQLNLYFTLGCHLCELAEQVVSDYNAIGEASQLIQLQKIDIALDAQLVEKYGIHIPVLENSSTSQTLYWPFDVNSLIQFMTEV